MPKMRFRSLSMASLFALPALMLVAPYFGIYGQTAAPAQKTKKEAEPVKPGRVNKENEAAEIKLRALGLLDKLIGDLGSVEDRGSRIVMKAKIADALWEHEESKARKYFEDAVDEMLMLLNDRNIGSSGLTKNIGLIAPAHQALVKLLGLVSGRDQKLARRLIEALNPKDKDEESNYANSAEKAQNYSLFALGVLDSNVELSVELAGEGSAKVIDSAFITYLAKLRVKDPRAAEALFVKTLESVRQTPSGWALNLEMLGMYALPGYGSTPIRYNLGLGADQPTDAESSRRFLEMICEGTRIQLKESVVSVPGDNEWLKNAGATSLILFKLHPYFVKSMPECADIIRMRADALMKTIPSAPIQEALAKLSKQMTSEELLAESSAVKSKDEQDRYYMRAVLQALDDGEWDQALRFAEMFNNETSRTYWRSEAGYRAAVASLNKKDVDTAAPYIKLITNAENIARIFSRMAILLNESRQFDRAVDALRQGQAAVEKSGGEGGQSDALLLLSNAAAKIDEMLAFELAKSAIKILNRLAQEATTRKGAGSGGSMRRPSTARLEESVSLLARVNFDESILLASLIEDSQSSSQSRLEICRAVLKAPAKTETKGPIK